MRPLPSRVLFSLLVISFVVLGFVTRQTIFFILAPLPLLFFATSLATSKVPLTRTLSSFRNHAVDVRLWGAPPPGTSGTTLIVSSVNVISFGIHVFFTAPDGSSIHLKIAQPRKATLAPDHVVIAVAWYVQWNVTKLKPSETFPAVSIALAAKTEGSA